MSRLFLLDSSSSSDDDDDELILTTLHLAHIRYQNMNAPRHGGSRPGRQHPTRAAASSTSGQQGGSGSHPSSQRQLQFEGEETTNKAMSPTPLPSGGEQYTEVVVVRHGESTWNASRIVQGQMDPELNEIGRQQATMVAHRLSREARPAAIYSSDLKHAVETAEIIAKACDVSNLVLSEALRERHMGHLQGLAWHDAVSKNPEVFKGFDIFKVTESSNPDSRNQEIPGGGESLNQLTERCISYLNKIAQEHNGERVAVVSHGAAILELCRNTDPPNSSIRRNIPNTSLNVFRISSTGRWILERCGDAGHLRENGFLQNTFGGDGASA